MTESGAMKLWLMFALLTVGMWGVYGVFLHTGAMGMADKENGRYKAFLLVGVAYFVVAIVGPMLILWMRGADWGMPAKGVSWSFIAGVVGALGALFVLMAFGSGGKPPAVMSIVFAGAPIVNAIVALSVDPPPGGFRSVPWPFFLGIVLAATGGFLVVKFKPDSHPPTAPKPREAQVELDLSKYIVT